MNKIIQITTMEKSLIALMDDGTIWKKSNIGTFAEDDWKKMDLPKIN